MRKVERKINISDKKYHTNDPKRYQNQWWQGVEKRSYNRIVFSAHKKMLTVKMQRAEANAFFVFIFFLRYFFLLSLVWLVQYSKEYKTRRVTQKKENIYENSNGALTSKLSRNTLLHDDKIAKIYRKKRICTKWWANSYEMDEEKHTFIHAKTYKHTHTHKHYAIYTHAKSDSHFAIRSIFGKNNMQGFRIASICFDFCSKEW